MRRKFRSLSWGPEGRATSPEDSGTWVGMWLGWFKEEGQPLGSAGEVVGFLSLEGGVAGLLRTWPLFRGLPQWEKAVALVVDRRLY